MVKDKINILSVQAFGLSFGGDETRLLNQCRLLNKNIFNCIVCTPISGRANMLSHFEAEKVKMIYIKVLPFNMQKMWRPVRFILLFIDFVMYYFQLLMVIYREKIDIVDGRLLGGGFYGLLTKQITRLPVLVTLYHKNESNSILSILTRYLLRFSDAIICDSEIRTRELKRWVGSGKPEYLIIPSAIELKYSSDPEIEQVKKDKLISQKIIIGQIARILPFKGQDLLIKAFHSVAKKYENVELWIIGFPKNLSYYNSLIQTVKDLSIEDRVRFLSYPNYIGNIFQVIDIQVHATRFDSLPNSILEGMSIGKPLIASSVGGIPEVIKNGETGLLFETNNKEELSLHLERLVTDSKLRQRLGQAAKKRFEEYYSPATLTGRMERAFMKFSKVNLAK